MARHVTISTVAPPPFVGAAGLSHTDAITRMQELWRSQLDAVIPDRPDLIVLPEACDRFADHSTTERLDYYRQRGDAMRDFFADVAARNSCYIAYSAIRVMDDGTLRNATQILDRQGHVAGIYHKNYPTICENRDQGILCGAECQLIETDFGKIACVICFDLNFDELRLRVKALQPDLIVFCSAYHGGMMQEYWAYSCRAHFVGSVFGTHPSSIINPVGKTLACTTNYCRTATADVNLDCVIVHYDYNGEKLEAAKQKYGRGVVIYDPGLLGSVLLTSEREDVSAREMAREFEIEVLDDYWPRATAHRLANLEPPS